MWNLTIPRKIHTYMCLDTHTDTLHTQLNSIMPPIFTYTHTHTLYTQLKNRYSVQIEDLRQEYRKREKEIEQQRKVADKELAENKEQLDGLRDKVKDAMEKAAYYGEQAAHATQDAESRRRRTEHSRVSLSLILSLLVVTSSRGKG
jgi:hypothetical protein